MCCAARIAPRKAPTRPGVGMTDPAAARGSCTDGIREARIPARLGLLARCARFGLLTHCDSSAPRLRTPRSLRIRSAIFGSAPAPLARTSPLAVWRPCLLSDSVSETPCASPNIACWARANALGFAVPTPACAIALSVRWPSVFLRAQRVCLACEHLAQRLLPREASIFPRPREAVEGPRGRCSSASKVAFHSTLLLQRRENRDGVLP